MTLNIRPRRVALMIMAAVLLGGCGMQIKIITEVDNRIGEYTFDRNARTLLLGRIDELRTELYNRSVEQNYEGEYKAYKKAQKIVLAQSDKNKDKHITADEIYGLDVNKVKKGLDGKGEEEPISKDNQVGEYTVDKNAHHYLMGQIDQLRKDLMDQSQNQNNDAEYKAFKQAQDLILGKADVNGDKHITPDEIYQVDIEAIKRNLPVTQ